MKKYLLTLLTSMCLILNTNAAQIEPIYDGEPGTNVAIKINEAFGRIETNKNRITSLTGLLNGKLDLAGGQLTGGVSQSRLESGSGVPTFDLFSTIGWNAFIGKNAGGTSTGSNKYAYGSNAGRYTSGNNQTFLGNYAGIYSTNSNYLYIENWVPDYNVPTTSDETFNSAFILDGYTGDLILGRTNGTLTLRGTNIIFPDGSSISDADTLDGQHGSYYEGLILNKFNFTGEQDGQFLQFNVGEGKYKPVSSTVSNHNLFSSTHGEDVDYTNAPSYGDSLMYDGDKWTPGKFGDWAYDMEYVSITGGVNIANSVNGTYTNIISNMTGDGLIPSNIRMLYIRCTSHGNIYSYWGNVEVASKTLTGSYTNFNTLKSTYHTEDGHADTALLTIPVGNIENDPNLVFRLSGSSGQNSYAIVGALQTKKQALSPDVDIIHLGGDVAGTTNSIVTATSVPESYKAWISSSTNTYSSPNTYSNIFPILIPEGTSKTTIEGKLNFTSAGSGDEPSCRISIVVKWNERTVRGMWASQDGAAAAYQNGGIFFGNVGDDITATVDYFGSYKISVTVPRISTIPGAITGLPIVGSYDGFNYTITHYKTAQSNVNTNLFETDKVSHANIPSSQAVVDYVDRYGYGVKKLPEHQRGRTSLPCYTDGLVYITTDDEIMAWGNQYDYRFGTSSDTIHVPGINMSLPPDDNEIPDKVYIGRYNIATITKNKNVYMTGNNTDGQCTPITGGVTDIGVFTKCTVTNVVKVLLPDVDGGNSVFLTQSGDVYVAGNNSQGQVGNGTTAITGANGAYKSLTHNVGILSGNKYIVDIVDGGGNANTMCALVSDGTVLTVGYLANTNGATTYTWVKLPTVTNAVELQMAGMNHAGSLNDATFYALTSTGNLYGWGYNTQGQLATGNTTFQPTPVLVWNGVSKFWAGGRYGSLFVYKNNNLYATGYNASGQLGLGDTVNRSSLTTCNINVANINFEVYIANNSANGMSTYLITETNGMYATGYNVYGQLGVGDTTARSTFTKCITTLGKTHAIMKDVPSVYSSELQLTILDDSGVPYAAGYSDKLSVGFPLNTQKSFFSRNPLYK